MPSFWKSIRLPCYGKLITLPEAFSSSRRISEVASFRGPVLCHRSRRINFTSASPRGVPRRCRKSSEPKFLQSAIAFGRSLGRIEGNLTFGEQSKSEDPAYSPRRSRSHLASSFRIAPVFPVRLPLTEVSGGSRLPNFRVKGFARKLALSPVAGSDPKIITDQAV